MNHIPLILILAAVAFHGCRPRRQASVFPPLAHIQAEIISVPESDIPVRMGGYGSSMAYNPSDSCFYLLTDRGPNVDATKAESKVFPVTAYTPAIGKFRLRGDSLLLVGKIPLCDAGGTPFNGLPNSMGDGVTGETAYDIQGRVIVNRERGIDPEGLAIAPDGTFWVSDEYGPFILQFDRMGRFMRELKPSAGLPSYYNKRRPNRGMEGLAISKDGKKLYGIMQSPLYWPDSLTKSRSVNNRIVEIDLRDGSVREYLYRMDAPSNVVSEVCYIDGKTLLVLERDDLFPQNGRGVKLIYRIDLRQASDISGKTVETLSVDELLSLGISPVGKELFFDILKEIPSYPHDKPEGIGIIPGSVLCIVNDDDFGIASSEDGKYSRKINPAGQQDRTVMYFRRVTCFETTHL